MSSASSMRIHITVLTIDGAFDLVVTKLCFEWGERERERDDHSGLLDTKL